LTSYGGAVSVVASLGSQIWEMAAFSAGATGNPGAFFAACTTGLFAGGGAMLKNKGAAPHPPPRQWGLTPAFGVATAVADGGGANLDGGASNSPAGSQPYDWVSVNIGSDTGNPGNPSQTMAPNSAVVNGTPLAIHAQQALVTVYGT